MPPDLTGLEDFLWTTAALLQLSTHVHSHGGLQHGHRYFDHSTTMAYDMETTDAHTTKIRCRWYIYSGGTVGH